MSIREKDRRERQPAASDSFHDRKVSALPPPAMCVRDGEQVPRQEEGLKEDRRQKRLERQRRVLETAASNPRRVLSFHQWCALNGFSIPTGRRLMLAGNGPKVVQLSARRIGVRESDNLAWQQSRIRDFA